MRQKTLFLIAFPIVIVGCNSNDAQQPLTDSSGTANYTVVVKPTSSFVILGDKFIAELYVVQDLPAGTKVEGVNVVETLPNNYVFEETADAPGLKKVSGTVEFIDNRGTKQKLPFESQYMVAPPTAAICAKYLVKGIDNSLAISAAGFAPSEIQVVASSGTVVAGKMAGEYSINPPVTGKCTITVKNGSNVIAQQDFEVIEKK
jgi:hypothetical protein